jgi:predicted esterase
MQNPPMRPLAAIACLVGCLALPPAGAAGVSSVETFDAYSPLADAIELARRTQTPTTADRLERYVAATGTRVEAVPVDLREARFDVYVPSAPRADGRYGLMVWVSPFDEATGPGEFQGALDRHGMILVAARGSGNEQSLLVRRLPLALHAAHNILLRHAVDPERVYAGGYSGGSRTAFRLAIDFPDVFRGALLNAGSDVLGGEAISPPAADLLARVQARSRFVYVTGVRDLPNRVMDEASRVALQAHCVQAVERLQMSRGEHPRIDRRHFARALEWLDADGADPVDAGALAACRERLDGAVSAELDAVDARIAAGDFDGAGTLLADIDHRRGGLAAPRSIELARELAAHRNGQASP